MRGSRVQRQLVDTQQAVEKGVPHQIIIFKIEKYFGMKYWQNWSEWQPEYRYMVKSDFEEGNISAVKNSSIHSHRTLEGAIIDWYDLNMINLPELLAKKHEFDEDQL